MRTQIRRGRSGNDVDRRNPCCRIVSVMLSGALLAVFPAVSVDAQPVAGKADRTIEPLHGSGVTAVADPGRQLRPSGSRHLRVILPSNIVGDANGDGLFDTEDARFLRSLLSGKRIVLRRDHPALADVAEPCGQLTGADLGLVIAALRAQPTGYALDSECHRSQPIGAPLVERDREAPSTPVTLDDRFAEVSDLVPEFGGLYFENGVLKIVLTDTDEAVFERAVRAVVATFGEEFKTPDAVEPAEGKYRFKRLKSWQGRSRSLLYQDEITSLDVDERRNRVTVGLRELADRGAVEEQLVAMGIPAEAVHYKERKLFRPDNHELLPVIQNEIRPLRGGIEIGPPSGMGGSECTMGFLAWRAGGIGFVTNDHCTDSPATIGTPWAQPTSGTQVGTETVTAGTFTGGQCPDGCTCTFADAAFVRLDPGVTGRIGLLSKSSHYWPHNLTSRVSTADAVALCGQHVHRVGRSSGHQESEVTETCCDIGADWSTVPNSPGVVYQLCQTIMEGGAAGGGNSGGPVFDTDWGMLEVALLGLYWGSVDDVRGYAPIANVEAELGTLWPEWSNEDPTPTITQPQQDAVVSWGAMPTVNASATYFDFEDGDCSDADCEISWVIAGNGGGVVGVGPVIDGQSSLQFTLGGPGKHLLVAVAKDSNGALGTDWVEFSTGNSPPQVWIEWPVNGQQVYAGFTYLVQGNSLDNELFHALDCSALEWDFPPGAAPSSDSGCTAQVVFNGLGSRTLTLTGSDPAGESATAQAWVNVVNAPANTGPQVTWLAPANNSGLSPGGQANLVVRGKDPDGKSPISYQWFVSGSMLMNSAGQIAIGATSGADNATTSITWKPSGDVMGNCGGTPVQLQVIATDADGDTGSATLDVVVGYDPC